MIIFIGLGVPPVQLQVIYITGFNKYQILLVQPYLVLVVDNLPDQVLNYFWFKFYFILLNFFKGSFIYQFNAIGTYNYWSGLIDNDGISLRGVINVGPSIDKYLAISVSVAGYTGIF